MNKILLSTKSYFRAHQSKLSLFALSLGITSLSFGQGPEVLHYRFNGTGTSVPNEASAPPVGTTTATIMGSVTQGNAGECGGALVGTGNSASSDYLNTGYAPAIGTGSWTISMWTSNFGPTSTLFYVFGDNNTNSFRCFTNGVAGPNNWIIRGAGITDLTIPGGATAAPHVSTFVYDQTVNTLYGYLDGVLVATVVQTAPNLTGTGPFKVMGYATNVGAPGGGLIDEFRWYSRALTAAEVLALNGGNTTSTVNVTQCGAYTSPSGNYTYTSSGTYIDTIPNVFGCDSIMTLNVNITSPVLAANATQTSICDGGTTTLYGTGGTTYNWTGGITDNVPFTPTMTSYYTVDGVDTNGCYWIDSILITVNPNPIVIGNSDQTICEGDTITLTGSGALTYSWTNGIVDGAPFAPTSSTIYTVTGIDANGCSGSDNVTITVNPNTSTTLTEVSIGSYTLNGQTYDSTGVYTQVIPNANGCDSTITLNLTVSGVGLGEHTSTFSVYPNPAKDQFVLQSASLTDASYTVTDVQGRGVLSGKLSGEKTIISVQTLKPGVYHVHVEKATEPIKLVIQ